MYDIKSVFVELSLRIPHERERMLNLINAYLKVEYVEDYGGLPQGIQQCNCPRIYAIISNTAQVMNYRIF